MIILFKDYPVFKKKKKKDSFKQIFPKKQTTMTYLYGGEERDRIGKETKLRFAWSVSNRTCTWIFTISNCSAIPGEGRGETRVENNLGLTRDKSINSNAGGGQDSEILKSFVFLTLCLGTARSEVGNCRLNIITAGMRKLFTEGPPQKSGMKKC